MARRIRRGAGPVIGGLLSAALLPAALLSAALLSTACGNGDDLNPYARLDETFEPIEVFPARPYPPPERAPVDEVPGRDPIGGNTAGAGSAGDVPSGDVPPVDGSPGVGEAPAVDPDVCVTPAGVSGAPRSMSEALVLMNSLPKPVSLACFLQALERPLSLYMTSSDRSLQPSPGARSPRTFIVYEPMVLSIVLDGPARIALELGYRTSPSRSVKTEILFPLETDVTFANIFDEVRSGNLTKCGACHTGEVISFHPDLPIDVYESDIIAPFDIYEVGVDALRLERASCDTGAEPERCALLSAIFDHGTVRSAPGGIMF
jgi:hypothetical protein